MRYFSLYIVCTSFTTIVCMDCSCTGNKHGCTSDEVVNWYSITGGKFDSVYQIFKCAYSIH